MITIKSINLYSDWVENVKSELETKGYLFISHDLDEISVQYFNYLKRIIPTKPRQIKKSDVFSCPLELTTALAQLENKILSGQNLLPHLSKKLKDLDQIDDLLYDWGIFHLHLGTTIGVDGYINRTGPLLFGFYDDTFFYFLNVMPHGSWTRQEMLRTIHNNFPDTIDNYRIKNKDVVGLSHNVTDDEIKKLRKASINVLIEVEPKVIYATPGGGFVASGHSTEVMRKHLNNKEELEDFEQKIKDDPEKFLGSVFENDISFVTNKNLNFKLIKQNSKYVLRETTNNFTIELNR
jgi:hypothetical protein